MLHQQTTARRDKRHPPYTMGGAWTPYAPPSPLITERSGFQSPRKISLKTRVLCSAHNFAHAVGQIMLQKNGAPGAGIAEHHGKDKMPAASQRRNLRFLQSRSPSIARPWLIGSPSVRSKRCHDLVPVRLRVNSLASSPRHIETGIQPRAQIIRPALQRLGHRTVFKRANRLQSAQGCHPSGAAINRTTATWSVSSASCTSNRAALATESEGSLGGFLLIPPQGGLQCVPPLGPGLGK